MQRQNTKDTRISKTLAWMLRHGAASEGIPIQQNGFIDVDVLLNHKAFKTLDCTADAIERIINNDAKGRYTLKRSSSTGSQQIRANQGHSIKVDELQLTPIVNAKQFPIVVHGTYLRHWDAIKRKGLCRMNRNHIHLACFDKYDALRDQTAPLSGFRNNCQLLIYIDMKKAMSSGIKFFTSTNNVILTEGIDGVLSAEYILKVVNRSDGSLINC